MQKVLFTEQIAEISDFIEPDVFSYISERQTESFECYEKYSLIAFDWYDTDNNDDESAQMLIYLDRDDLFFLCENELSHKEAELNFEPATTNERALYDFFRRMLKDEMSKLESFEDRIDTAEDDMLRKPEKGFLNKILSFRKELFNLKTYYQQLNNIFDLLSENENNLLSLEGVNYFASLRARTDRFLNYVISLRDYVSQLREAYQSQIDIEQNDLMKVFTVITAVFLPLTLLVGWYGMNFNMPEFTWKYGYLAVIAASVLISLTLILFFKRKKWL